MNFEKYFLALSRINDNRALHLFMQKNLSIYEIEAILIMKHEDAKSAVLSLKEAGIVIENTGKTDMYVRFKVSEKFTEESKMLYDYLRHQYKKEEGFQKDLRRLRLFEEKNITIEEIVADKAGVIKQLERK